MSKSDDEDNNQKDQEHSDDEAEETHYETDNIKRKRSLSSRDDNDDEAVKKVKPHEKASASSYQTASSGSDGTEDCIVMEVAPDKVGQIIGSRGAIIQEIQTRTGAKAFVNQDFPDGVNRQVKITGTTAQTKACAELIKMIIDQGPQAIHVGGGAGGSGPTITTVMECSQAQVGKVIGTGGATIKELQTKSGARIQIDQDFPPEVPRKINMTGTAQAVSMAMQLINSVITNGAAAMGLPGGNPNYPNSGAPPSGGGGGYHHHGPSSYGAGPPMAVPQAQFSAGGGEAKMDVPRSVVGKIIGRGGETITMIQRKSGAKVMVDQSVPDGHPCRINITGTPQSVVMAQQQIADILNNLPDFKGQGGYIPPVSLPPGGGGYGMPPHQQQPYGMPAYGMPPMQQPYGGGYGGYQPPPMQQQYPPYGMPPPVAAPVGGYPAYGAAPTYGGHPAAAPAAAAGHYAPPPAAAAPKPAAPVWTEHKTDEGITYYYNAATGVSQVSFAPHMRFALGVQRS